MPYYNGQFWSNSVVEVVTSAEFATGYSFSRGTGCSLAPAGEHGPLYLPLL